MNSYSNLESIDLATQATLKKYTQLSTNEDLIYNSMSKNIENVITDNNYRGFTRSSSISRDELREIGEFGFKTEFLRNIVKVIAYKRSLGLPEASNIFSDVSRIDEVKSSPYSRTSMIESGIFNQLEASLHTENSGAIGYELLNDPKILKEAIKSFVENRYRKGLLKELDKAVEMNPECLAVLNSIDQYYTINVENNKTK